MTPDSAKTQLSSILMTTFSLYSGRVEDVLADILAPSPAQPKQ
jgi:hypothetical protein